MRGLSLQPHLKDFSRVCTELDSREMLWQAQHLACNSTHPCGYLNLALAFERASEYSCSELPTLHTTHLTYIGWSDDIICHPNALHEHVANSDLVCGLGWLRNYNMFCFIPSKAHAFASQECYMHHLCCGQAKQNGLTWHSSFKGCCENGGVNVLLDMK